MPNEKIELAIFDNDLKCRTVKKYEVSDDGTQVRVVTSGENFWMPRFDMNSGLYLPRRKKFLFFGVQLWKQLYFVQRKGVQCINFQTGESYGPNPEQQKEILGANLLKQIGKPEGTGMTWWHWAVLVFSFLSFLILLNVSGVI